MTKSSKLIPGKKIAIAVATVCMSLSLPASGNENKRLLDLMLKRGVITQKDYDEYIEASKDEEENKAFRELRTDQNLAKVNDFMQKNADAGKIMKNGIGFQSADGRNTIQLTGRMHMDYRAYDPQYASSVITPVDSTIDQLDVRRARLGVKGQFEKDWKYEFVGSYGVPDNGMSDSASVVDVAYFDYAANPALSYRFGKFKMPYSLEQLTSSNNIDFMERSMANQNEGEYVPGKETGVMVFGSPRDGTSYGLALSRGRINKSAGTDSSDFIGRGTVNFAKTFMDTDDYVTHLGYGYSRGEISPSSQAFYQSARDESRAFNNFFKGQESVKHGSTRTRSDVEYAVAYGPLKLQGEFFKVGYTTTDEATRNINIRYNEILWNLTGESHNYNNATGTFGTIKPNSKFTDKGGLGAWQIGVRYTNFDASDFTPALHTTDKATAWTYGLNWYLNEYVRFMLNYVTTSFDDRVGLSTTTGVTGHKAIMLRSQINF